MNTLTRQAPEYVQSLTATEGTQLSDLSDAPLVAISSVKFTKLDVDSPDPLHRYEALRYRASLAATAAYANMGVPQIVMFDGDSHYLVPVAFAEHGAIVVQTPRPGLARPYLDAAHLVRLYAGPNAGALKAESDKLLDYESLALILKLLEDGYDVLVGDRTAESMATLTAIQHRTEALIDTLAASTLAIPHGASCGVQAYSAAGLLEFLEYERLLGTLGDNWKYLLSTPALAARNDLSVSAVPVNVSYDEDMVAAENIPAIALKRLEQLLLMLEGVFEVADMLGFPDPCHMRVSVERQQVANTALGALRVLVAASV